MESEVIKNRFEIFSYDIRELIDQNKLRDLRIDTLCEDLHKINDAYFDEIERLKSQLETLVVSNKNIHDKLNDIYNRLESLEDNQ